VAKQTGLTDNMFIDGNNVSGDVGSIDLIACPLKVLDVTDISQAGHARIGGVRDGNIKFTAYFDAAAGQIHSVLRSLPRTDRIVTYCRGLTIGNPAAMMIGKQIGYDGKRGQDGSYTFSVDAQANAYGMEWGNQLTAGLRTDTAATNGTAYDYGATIGATSFGFQAYLHVNAFTGTDVTIKLQDSADNVTFADLASGAFTQVTTTTPQAQRIAVGGVATVRRYVRASTVTTGGFTSCTFAVALVKNQLATNF
jgi:hypothetical protein